MDILYLSADRLNEMQTICSDRLLERVLDSFRSKYRIVYDSKEHPKDLWCIDEFLKDPSCHRIYKAFVFEAFAFSGHGFFKFENGVDVFGDMSLLKELLDRNCILKEEYDAFVHMIYEARQGTKPLKFDLLDETENAPD